ncbi:MAG: hypothetical protein H6Q97_693, partial [Nitrospirae bacterium]|nr:hypothetical protein [Nitrospirota bacterium]
MKKPGTAPGNAAALRKKAEKKLSTQLERPQKPSARGTRDLVHELGTHQIELEMQNEELRKTQDELEASRNRYADLYDFAPVGYLTFDKAGVIREVNLTAANLLGIERRSLVKKPFSAFVSKDDRDAFQRHCSEVSEERTKQSIEIRLKRWKGTDFFALLESIAVEDPDGKAVTVRTAISDITGRTRAEKALQESELRYRSLFENMLDGYAYCRVMYDKSGRPVDFVYLSVNSAFEHLTGLKDVVGMRVTDVIPGIRESHPELLETYGRVAATGRTEKFETEFKPLGMWLSISVYSTERDHFTAVFDNITERKNAAQALGRSEEKFRLLFENMAEGFALYELLYDDHGKPVDWRVLEVNDAYSVHTGIPREQIEGRRMSELFPEAIPEYLPRFAEVVAGQKAVEFETYTKRTDRHQHVVSFPAGPHRFANTITDITLRKRLEKQTAHLASFPQLNPNPVIEVDAAGNIVFANPGTERVLESLGMDKGEVAVFLPKDLDAILKVLEMNNESSLSREVTVKDRVFSETVNLVPQFNVARIYAYDITQRRRAEEELQKSERGERERAEELAAMLEA